MEGKNLNFDKKWVLKIHTGISMLKISGTTPSRQLSGQNIHHATTLNHSRNKRNPNNVHLKKKNNGALCMYIPFKMCKMVKAK